MTLAPEAVFVVTVLSQGYPVPWQNLTVTQTDEDSLDRHSFAFEAKETGRARLRNLAAGTYKIVAVIDGKSVSATETVEAGETREVSLNAEE